MSINKASVKLALIGLLNQAIGPSFAGPHIRPVDLGNTPLNSAINLEPAWILANKTDDIPESSSPSNKEVNAGKINDSINIYKEPEINQEQEPLGGNTETPIEEETPEKSTQFPNPFGLDIPLKRSPYDFSHKKHCDVLRHLKVPATPRRLDSYMRPEYILTRSKSTDKLNKRDQLFQAKHVKSYM